MLTINDLTNSLAHTWESVSQGWHHLVSQAEHALTRFHTDGDHSHEIPVRSPRWGLISADMFDDNDKMIIKLEVPGLDVDDIDINVVNNVLTISGEKRFQREETKGEYRLLECAYGSFTRSIPLHDDVDTDSAKASYDKGVLKIALNKRPHKQRRHININ